jgi:ABC-2 type transport system permease protein
MNVTWLLIKRDYIERVRQRSFIVGTIIFAVLIIASSLLPGLIAAIGGASIVKLAVAAPDAQAQAAIAKSLPKQDYKVTFVSVRPNSPALPQSLRTALDKDQYDAALVAYREPSKRLSFAYYPKKTTALDSNSSLQHTLLQAVILSSTAKYATQTEALLNFKFETHSLNNRYKSDADQVFSQIVAYFLLILLYVVVVMYGAFVAQGVIEEKANRIMEVMIGAVRPSQLLAGKIFGIGGVALTQLCVLAAAAATATVVYGLVFGPTAAAQMQASPQSAQQQAAMMQAFTHVPWSSLVYLVIYFLLGFFSYSSLYAGIASLLSKPEEVQQYSFIITFPILAAYLLSFVALANPDLPVVAWLSMLPLLSPLLMFTRIATTTVPFWQIGVSIVLSLVAIWGFTILAGKLYRVGVLMYGKPPKPSEILRALRTPT